MSKLKDKAESMSQHKAKSIQTFIISYLYDNELHRNTCFFPPNCIHSHFLPVIRPSHFSKLPKPSSVARLVRFLSVTVGKSLNMRPYRCFPTASEGATPRSFLDALFPLICISCWDTGWIVAQAHLSKCTEMASP